MYLFVVSIHVIVALLLVLIIILQPGKGGDVGAAFGGGGGSELFGPRGPTSFLSQATTIVAIVFMVTSITLAWYSNKDILANSNVLEELERLGAEKTKAEEVIPAAEPEVIEEGAPAEEAPVIDVELEAAPEAPVEEAAGEE